MFLLVDRRMCSLSLGDIHLVIEKKMPYNYTPVKSRLGLSRWLRETECLTA
jgi:hypothetical protein